MGTLEQFSNLAAVADLEKQPVLPQPWHVPVSARYTMSDINPRAFKEFKVMLPHQRHRKEMFTSVTIVTLFCLLTFKKKRDARKPRVSQTP